MNHKLIAASIIFTCLTIDLATDLSAKRDPLTGKWNVSHKRGVWYRILAAIPATLFYCPSLILWLPFWAFFDGVIAWVIYRNPFILGSTSALDKIQRKYKILPVAKWVLAVLSIVTYILW